MRYIVALVLLCVAGHAQMLPEAVAPYIGGLAPVAGRKPTVRMIKGFPVYETLPDKPYIVLGDIWMDSEDTRFGNLVQAVRIAKETPGTALLLASTAEVYAQHVRGTPVLSTKEIRAWLIQDVQDVSPENQTIDPSLLHELERIAVKLEKLEGGRIPRGFTYPTYKALLEHNRRELLSEIQHQLTRNTP